MHRLHFLGYSGVHEELRRGQVSFVRLAAPGIKWRLSLAQRRGKSSTLAVRAMTSQVVAAIRRDAQRPEWRGTVIL